MDYHTNKRAAHDNEEHTPTIVSSNNVSSQTSGKIETATNAVGGKRLKMIESGQTTATATDGEEGTSAETQLVRSLGLGNEASTALSTYLTNLKSEVINLKSEVTNLKPELTNLTSELTDLKSEVTSLKFEDERTKKRLDTLEGRLDHLSGEF